MLDAVVPAEVRTSPEAPWPPSSVRKKSMPEPQFCNHMIPIIMFRPGSCLLRPLLKRATCLGGCNASDQGSRVAMPTCKLSDCLPQGLPGEPETYTNILCLPPDVLSRILALEPSTRVRAAQVLVCKDWAAVHTSHSDVIWTAANLRSRLSDSRQDYPLRLERLRRWLSDRAGALRCLLIEDIPSVRTPVRQRHCSERCRNLV